MKHSIDGRCIADERLTSESAENDERVSCCRGGRSDGTKRICGYSSLINQDGQTKLHLLCQNNTCSMEQVQELINAFPAALCTRDVYGRSPLFYALKRGCSIDVINVLFDGCPDAMLFKDFCGDTPLYLLYHPSKDSRILQHALKKMPSLAVFKEHSFSGQPLVSRICAPWTSKEIFPTRTEMQTNATLKDRWTKLVLTVRAAHTYTTGQEENSIENTENARELHVALEYSCPPMVLCHFVEMYPEQASMPMKKFASYPLHYYLGRCEFVNCSRVIVQRLIKAFPQAVHERHNGRLPLHLALLKGRAWHDGIQDLVFAGPESLECAEPTTGMVPFLQAAASEWCNLSTVYCLLRENPAVIGNIRHGCPSNKVLHNV